MTSVPPLAHIDVAHEMPEGNTVTHIMPQAEPALVAYGAYALTRTIVVGRTAAITGPSRGNPPITEDSICCFCGADVPGDGAHLFATDRGGVICCECVDVAEQMLKLAELSRNE
jgi:hypothetical protein